MARQWRILSTLSGTHSIRTTRLRLLPTKFCLQLTMQTQINRNNIAGTSFGSEYFLQRQQLPRTVTKMPRRTRPWRRRKTQRTILRPQAAKPAFPWSTPAAWAAQGAAHHQAEPFQWAPQKSTISIIHFVQNGAAGAVRCIR